MFLDVSMLLCLSFITTFKEYVRKKIIERIYIYLIYVYLVNFIVKLFPMGNPHHLQSQCIQCIPTLIVVYPSSLYKHLCHQQHYYDSHSQYVMNIGFFMLISSCGYHNMIILLKGTRRHDVMRCSLVLI